MQDWSSPKMGFKVLQIPWEVGRQLGIVIVMKINKEQESALIGMVLGDAYLQKTGERNARIRLEHRADHSEYLVWKTRLLPQLFQGKPIFLNRKHPKTQRIYSYVRQQSNASPYVGKIRKLFYPDGKKK